MYTKEFAVLLAAARKKKGLTQEEVCIAIGISDAATISRWEGGKDIPSEKVMAKLVQVYEDNLLGYTYLQSCTELGKLVLPPIVVGGLDNLVLRFQKEYKDIEKIRSDMIVIACDGRVNEDEVERWKDVRKEVAELAGVSLPLLLESFRQSKKPQQDGSLIGAII